MERDSFDSNSNIISLTAARISIFAAAMVIFLLAALHFLSPEFAPASRMVSEYALGGYSWVLSLMFISWAISSWTLAYTLWSETKTIGGKIGLIFLIAAGIGEVMAAVFDVKHSLHGVAAMIGIPSLPIAAIFTSYGLTRSERWSASKKALLLTTALTWASWILMTAAVIVMFNGLSRTNGEMTPEVIALAGYANRILIVIYCVWVIIAARQATQVQS